MTSSRSLLRFTKPFVQPSSLLRISNPASFYIHNQFQFRSNIHTITRTMAQEYKLKGLSSLDLKPGEKREVEVEGIEEGKVLLCNVGGKISALGAKCTHYGAPLAKGVLTGDGRITCAWHGGTFSSAMHSRIETEWMGLRLIANKIG
jgi:nitrite reductase/ring-hydroxylating ferredoxin subunit